MWLVAKWKIYNEKDTNWDVFYCAIPESWVKYEGSRSILMWPLYSSVQRDRKEGAAIRGKVEENDSVVLKSGFHDFEEASKAEQSYYNTERDKQNLTTDYETDINEESTTIDQGALF